MGPAEIIEKYRKARNRLILLDYDGTLVNHAPAPEHAKPPEPLMALLKRLLARSRTKVMIVSGRAEPDIQKFLGHLPVDIIAEHGAMMKINGAWEKHGVDSTEWKNTILPIFNGITLMCTGSFLEEKDFSVTWHYRNAEPDSGYTQSRELVRILQENLRPYHLKLLDGNKVIEIIPEQSGKGNAVKKIIEQTNYDYILCIGDDKTDEEMFEFLLHDPKADTIKVGEGNTLAKYRLNTVNDVILLLERLSR